MKKFILFVLSAVTVAFAGCSESRHYVVETDVRQLNIGFSSSNHSITVTSEFDWEATSLNDWIILTKESGSAGVSKLDFHVEQSPTFDTRKGSIEICAVGSKEVKLITIAQQGNDFTFKIDELTDTTAKLTVTAKSETKTFYWYNVTDEDFSAYYERNTVTLMNGIRDMLQQYIAMGAFPSWSALISTGSDDLSVKGLKPDTEYMLFAFGLDKSGNITSKDASYVWYKTLSKE